MGAAQASRGEKQSVRANVKWGLGIGLVFAVACSVIVVVQYVLRGPQVVEARGIGLGAALAVYWAGGGVGGVLLGLLRPATRWRAGAVGVGILGLLPVCFAFASAIAGLANLWDPASIFGAVATAVIVGGSLGYYAWEPPREG